jgi:hypothetical protein
MKQQRKLFRVTKVSAQDRAAPVVQKSIDPIVIHGALYPGKKLEILVPVNGVLRNVCARLSGVAKGDTVKIAVGVQHGSVENIMRFEAANDSLARSEDRLTVSSGDILWVTLENVPDGITGLFSALFVMREQADAVQEIQEKILGSNAPES